MLALETRCYVNISREANLYPVDQIHAPLLIGFAGLQEWRSHGLYLDHLGLYLVIVSLLTSPSPEEQWKPFIDQLD